MPETVKHFPLYATTLKCDLDVNITFISKYELQDALQTSCSQGRHTAEIQFKSTLEHVILSVLVTVIPAIPHSTTEKTQMS